MTLTISLPPHLEAKLRDRASASGQTPADYVSRLVEQAVARPTLDEVLAPFRRQVDESGMSDEQIDEFFQGLREKAYQERRGRDAARS